jgi:hypothetical protein
VTAPDFDTEAAWLRRFTADAEGSLGAFALRLREALPNQVRLHESRGFFSRGGRITGVEVELGDNLYRLELQHGRLQATVALVVRGITLNTKAMNPADWFARLKAETSAASDQARALSESLSAFMAT